METNSIILVAITFGLVVIIVIIRSRNGRCTISGPKGWPILGIYPSLSKDVFKDFFFLSKLYGGIFSCRICTVDALIVCKREIMNDLFNLRAETFNDRSDHIPQELDIIIGFGELQYGDKWKELRSLAMNVLNKTKLGDKTFEDIFNKEMAIFIDFIKSYENRAFYPKTAVLRCMGNIFLYLMFGKRFCYDDPELENYLNAAHFLPQSRDPLVFFGVPSILQFLARYNIISIQKFRQSWLALKVIKQECLHELLSHRQQVNSDKNDDFVDSFLKCADKKRSEGRSTYLSDNSLRGVASNLFTGGLESTGTLLIWFIFLMTKYQNVQKKLRDEVNSVIGSERLPSLQDVTVMPYANAVLHECHRFASIAPLGMLHRVAHDTDYEGQFIPRNTYVIPNLWAVHHDDTIFPQPFEYKPERFINENGEFKKSKDVIPYGIGKRICPFVVLAERKLFLSMTQMIQQFDLRPEKHVHPSTLSTDGVYDGIELWAPEFKTRFLPHGI